MWSPLTAPKPIREWVQGLWQIMPATGRDLGLGLDATVDERLDPEAASWAAARYLKKARKTLTVAAKAKQPGLAA